MSALPTIIRSQRHQPKDDAAYSTGIQLQPLGGELRLSRENDDNRAAQLVQRGIDGFPADSSLNMLTPDKHLGYLSTSAIIVNRVVGSGIFGLAPILLSLLGSKSGAMIAWLIGSCTAIAGMFVYLEYGIQFPKTGGELYYIHYVWQKPKLLVTYMYAIMFVMLSGSQANALSFGESILIACTPEGTPVNGSAEKILAILVVGVICLAQAYTRKVNILLGNAIAAFKILVLLFISVVGWVAIGNQRTASAREWVSTPYGLENLQSSFSGTVKTAYNWGLALLAVERAYLGYENANLILQEVKRPEGDESRVFRRAAKVSMFTLCFLYIMVGLAFYAVCSTEELLNASDVIGLFFQKVFGPSQRARQASGTLVAISSAGNIICFTYSSVRVKQEIARMGLLPYPEFWAKSTYGQPGATILLHFISTTIIVISTPLEDNNGYLVASTLYTYTRTWVGILLGLGLLSAPYLQVFQTATGWWYPQSTRLGLWIIVPFTLLYTLANAFILILCWFPSDLGQREQILPTFVGPAVGTGLSVLGVVFWFFDLHLLPHFGYRMEAEERREGYVVHLRFQRYVSGCAMQVFQFLDRLRRQIGKMKTPNASL